MLTAHILVAKIFSVSLHIVFTWILVFSLSRSECWTIFWGLFADTTLITFLLFLSFTLFLLWNFTFCWVRNGVLDIHGSVLPWIIEGFHGISILIWIVIRIWFLNSRRYFCFFSHSPLIFLAHLTLHDLHLNSLLFCNQVWIQMDIFVELRSFLFQTWLQESSSHELYDIFIFTDV